MSQYVVPLLLVLAWVIFVVVVAVCIGEFFSKDMDEVDMFLFFPAVCMCALFACLGGTYLILEIMKWGQGP